MPSARRAGPYLARLRALHAAGSAEEEQEDDLLPPPPPSTPLNERITSNDQTEAVSEGKNYDFCTMKFGLMRQEENDYLTILDFAHMAALANYEPKDFPEKLRDYFPGWKVGKMCKRCMRKDSNDWTTFYEIWSPQNRTTVFLTRGTQDHVDLLQDINLWLSTGIAQLFAWFGPDVSILASDAAAILSNGMGTNWFTKDFFRGFLEYVDKSIKDDPERKYYFTGHSLGGGLAALVALEMSRVAVTFSSPGLEQVSKIVISNQERTKNADKLVYSIIPDKDLVPRVDAPLGSSLRIGCAQKNPAFCHRLQAAIRELKCGGCEEHIARLPYDFDAKSECSGGDVNPLT
jgi:hypothetical protein